MLRDLHGQLPARLDPAGQDAGDRRPALLARHERLHQAGGAAVHVAEGVGAARDHHHDHRRAGPQELVEQVRLHAREPEVLGVAALAGRTRARTGRRGRRRRPRTGRPRGPRPARPRSRTGPSPCTAQPCSWTISAPGSSAAQGIDRGLHLEAQPEARVARQHVVGEGVAAHERPRVGGAGPDDGHPAQRRAPVAEQRQRRPGVEQDDRPLGHLPGEGAVGGRVEVDGGRAGHRALRRPVRVEQPELHLLGEQPAGGPVDEGLRQLAPPHPLHQAGAEADGVRQLDVDAGGERQGAGLVDVRGDAVHRSPGTAPPSSRRRRCPRSPTPRAAGR